MDAVARSAIIEHAAVTLPGNRQENQDRVEIMGGADALLAVVVDGMGGHSGGSRAAAVTIETLRACFAEQDKPVFDPQGFLTLSLARVHDRVVVAGQDVPVDYRPRATCAVCLVQDGGTFWAHVGDSRIYHIRNGAVVERTRDHSHVELLLREGVIAEEEIRGHPMRNFVECCLGGDPALPDMSVTSFKRLRTGDVLLACTDGLWSGIDEAALAALSAEAALAPTLRALADRAVARNSPHSDNTSAVAVRWLGHAPEDASGC